MRNSFCALCLVATPVASGTHGLGDRSALVAAREALDRALAADQAQPTKETGLAVDQARAAYHAAVAEHGNEIFANYERLVGALGAARLEALLDPELSGPVRDYQALRAQEASAEAEAFFDPFASGTETQPNNTPATANPVATLDP